MGKVILTYNDIDDINRYLNEAGEQFEVHMHDLCGSQSFSIKLLDSMHTLNSESVRADLVKYFSEKGMTIKFSDNGMDFVVQ